MMVEMMMMEMMMVANRMKTDAIANVEEGAVQ